MLTDFHELDHNYFMREALYEAEEAGKRGDRPIGAVIVHQNEIIARGSNQIETKNSNILHAEIDAMNQCAPYLKKFA